MTRMTINPEDIFPTSFRKPALCHKRVVLLKRFPAVFAVLVLLSLGVTDNAHAQGDIYIRAQTPNGNPTGLHEILTSPKNGYYEAQYCGRSHWVMLKTVIWTEEQAAAGNILFLEENVGNSSRVLCVGPAGFATIEDLGLQKKDVWKLRGKPRSGYRKHRWLPFAQN